MRDWTQTELAFRAGVVQSHIVKVEKGGDVRLSTIERLVTAEGCRLIWRAKAVVPFPVR